MDSESGHMSLVVFKPQFVKITDNLSQHPVRIFHTHIFCTYQWNEGEIS